jgi:hypothetical protein
LTGIPVAVPRGRTGNTARMLEEFVQRLYRPGNAIPWQVKLGL